MKCARINLQERTKTKIKTNVYTNRKPIRYCQKRMINPDHDEETRWADADTRFYCHEKYDTHETLNSDRDNPDSDMFLSVQTLQFQGNSVLPKRSRNGFIYKSPSGRDTHRMFVKQVILDEEESSDDGRSSQLTSYYFDDYVKYLVSNDKSRPTSGKSSIFQQSLGNKKENKATQVDEYQGDSSKQTCHGINSSISKSFQKKCDKKDIQTVFKSNEADTDNTTIFFHKDARRKSLTISRTESPETVQVIRVDVVRNNSHGSVISDFADKGSDCNATEPLKNIDFNHIDMNKPHFANKYLLTNAIKALDENCGGEKVTLLCKTFKLSKRSQVPQFNKARVDTSTIQKGKTLKTT